MGRARSVPEENLRDQLYLFAHLPRVEQESRRDEIVEAFRAFWLTYPIERDFVIACSGLVWWPELQYIMVTRPPMWEDPE